MDEVLKHLCFDGFSGTQDPPLMETDIASKDIVDRISVFPQTWGFTGR
jgi:hypothetical protein